MVNSSRLIEALLLARGSIPQRRIRNAIQFGKLSVYLTFLLSDGGRDGHAASFFKFQRDAYLFAKLQRALHPQQH